MEALLLHSSGIQRHDSMYLFYPFLMVFLFSLLLEANQGERRNLRQLSAIVYLIHPWCIVLVRGMSKLVGLTGLLVENTVILFLLVLASSLFLSQLPWLRPSRPFQTGRAWIELDLSLYAIMSISYSLFSRKTAPSCQRSKQMLMGTVRY